MARTPARFTQADVARAIRAVPRGWRVRVEKSGDIIMEESPERMVDAKIHVGVGKMDPIVM